ncbi:septum formation inhibitor [Escherichia coli]|uniref:Septum formation inhibitor n=1 Tax=Escherichia coli TaxID=562 RepID=A0A377DDI2_ECOLX|nr:septum formation inhibitor [Escherichia coli]
MSNTPIELKGSSFTLSVVHLHEAEPKVIHQALEDKIAQAPAFLKHAPVGTQRQCTGRPGKLVSDA